VGREGRQRVAFASYASLALLGLTGFVPSLIRGIESDFGQSDAGMGLFYFLVASAYVAGSFGTGLLAGRLSRKSILVAALLLQAIGFAIQATTSLWILFLLAGAARGLSSGAIEAGVNALFIDLYPTSRGRALSLVHLSFSVGAFISPLAVGVLSDAGVPWQAFFAAAAVPCIVVAGAFAVSSVPTTPAPETPRGSGVRPDLTLALLALAIGCYVAAELGVASWLVRFLSDLPLVVATQALSLFWVGLTLGRLASAILANRFDPLPFATIAMVLGSLALVGAVLAPVFPVALILYGVAGFGFGPVYPLVFAIAGRLFPGRSSSVSGFLTGSSVIGAIVYPPLMGLVSVSYGLTPAMLGTAGLGFCCAIALLLLRRA
jgi:fucose permease